MNAEASRCLLCKKPKCSEACPVHTDVPSAMKLYREGNLTDAAKMLFENNPLSAITSQVCDWQIFCKGHCVLNARKMPVRWYEIEQEISMSYLP
ncbi:MAG: pyridine nucleotide-disulfide oxidoreductase, partial [Bacteroidales bacterium]|nr:pyridine nucleotide-disulfide oxidoreductase [Bacteroidales bacterium]